jgi:hypothetical protein
LALDVVEEVQEEVLVEKGRDLLDVVELSHPGRPCLRATLLAAPSRTMTQHARVYLEMQVEYLINN